MRFYRQIMKYYVFVGARQVLFCGFPAGAAIFFVSRFSPTLRPWGHAGAAPPPGVLAVAAAAYLPLAPPFLAPGCGGA